MTSSCMKSSHMTSSCGSFPHLQVSGQKRKCGYISPRRFVGRVKADNALFSSYMHQVKAVVASCGIGMLGTSTSLCIQGTKCGDNPWVCLACLPNVRNWPLATGRWQSGCWQLAVGNWPLHVHSCQTHWLVLLFFVPRTPTSSSTGC